jgi:hypothetical protein
VKLSRLSLFTLVLAGILAWSGVGLAKEVVRIRAIDPKPFYKPGDKIVLEMRCEPGVADVMVSYNPTLEGIDSGMPAPGDPKCPFSRFEIEILRNFIGKNHVSVWIEGRDQADVAFEFEVRSDVQPSDLWFSTDSQNEGCNFFYLRDEEAGPPSVSLFSVLPDGTRFDLCREGKARIAVVPPGRAVFVMEEGLCTLTLKKPGPLKVVASYRGLRKEWICTESKPDVEQFRTGDRATATVPAPVASDPPPQISIPAFRNDLRKLDRNPMDVGNCRLLQHWDTGYCYIYSLPESRKVSEPTDVRCTELDELRRRMLVAIEQGRCAVPATLGSAPAAASLSGAWSQVDKTMSDMRKLAIIAEAYAVDNGDYPAASDVPTLAKLAEPKYVRPGGTPLVDGWGTPYRYACDGKNYRIVSAGADRAFEPDSGKLDATPGGDTDTLARDLVYSNGHFIQWPKQEAR